MDVLSDFSFYKLFLSAEKVRWDMNSIPWENVEINRVDDWLVGVIKTISLSEVTTFSATHEFLSKFSDDLDFSQWLSVWFYEETKHSFVLMKWLSIFGEKFTEKHIHDARKIQVMRPDKMEMLAINIISEISTSGFYGSLAQSVNEPVLVSILKNLSGDELRHASSFFSFAQNTIQTSNNPYMEKLKALRILNFSLFSGDQSHPVSDCLRDLYDKFAFQSSLGGENFYAAIDKKALQYFSNLIGENLTSGEDVLDCIHKFRSLAQLPK